MEPSVEPDAVKEESNTAKDTAIDVNEESSVPATPLIRPATAPIGIDRMIPDLVRWVTAIRINSDSDAQEDPRTLHDPYDGDEKGVPEDIAPAVQWSAGHSHWESDKFVNEETFADIPRDDNEDEWGTYDPRYDDANGDSEAPPVPTKIYTGIAEVDLEFKERSKSAIPEMTNEDEWMELMAVIILKLGAKLLESDPVRFEQFARETDRHQEEHNNRELMFAMIEVMSDKAMDSKSRIDSLFAQLCHYTMMKMRF